MHEGEAAGFSRSSVRKRKSDHLMASKNRWLGVPRKKRVAQQAGGKTYLPCSTRRMRTPLPQQSSSSIMEEESLWSARERMAMARMEQHVNNSECIQLGVILAYMCVKLQMRLYVCHRVGPFWVHFGSILGPFWVHFAYCLSGDA